MGVVLMMLILSCKGENAISDNSSKQKETAGESFKRVVSDDDYNFQTEYNERLDTSFLDVVYKGRRLARYGYKGKIKSEAVTDLNKDNQNELYVVVANKAVEEVFGYHYSKGTFTAIKKRTFKQDAGLKSIAYSIERNQLVERYKVMNKEGQIEHRTSNYNLILDGHDFILLPQGWLPQELSKMGGQYAERAAAGSGYYKVMLLEDLGAGDWRVDIKVKENGTKDVLCDFVGAGYFVDRDLIVPLNNVNPQLKGSLRIRFLDLMAAVYTEDPNDSKEMITFCNGVGSIAGNFKKTNL